MRFLFSTTRSMTAATATAATAAILALLTATACTSAEQSPADQAAKDQAAHVQDVVAAGGVVDSILPIAEHLRRFRAELPVVDSLQQASPSLEALVARLARAVSTNDTTDLNAMVLNRQEFAYLYYPDSPMSKPPYEAPPELLWGQILASSDKGARQLVNRLGGSTITVSKLRCPAAADTVGHNLVHARCEVQFSAPGKPMLEGNLFGSVIERDGRFKFMGFANRI
ncbi:MAG TPA: hypothetical protein DGD08_02355 [Gemmatimonas aurantiaca]|nr:hypothetical protein [Gemmatimonas aurantiaca]